MKAIIGANPAPQPAEVRSVRVEEEDAGQRLDNFLLRLLKGVPKAHVYRIIRSGEVRVNKGRALAERRVVAGDIVRVPPVRTSAAADRKAAVMAEAPAAGGGPAREFPILFEDEAVLAIDKPAGVAVHGGSGISFGVIEQLRMARPQARFLELVHRLDRETSGILLVAKKRSALKHLQDQFRERETGKTYLALVAGTWPAKLKVLDKPLQRYLLPGTADKEGERRVRVVPPDHPEAMRSLSLVRVAQSNGHYSLLEVTLKTGRTHQIRVHLASEGFPIVGDDKYGDYTRNHALQRSTAEVPLRRMFLHAWRLQFTHPVGGQVMQLQSELPPELAQFLAHAMADPSPSS